MHNLTEFQAMAASAGLQKLLYGETFYVSDLKKLMEMMCKTVPPDMVDLRGLELLHCVKYGDMPMQLRQQVREKVLEILGLPPTILDQAAEVPQQGTPEEVAPGFFAKLKLTLRGS